MKRRGMSVSYIRSLDTVYPTRKGWCFVLYGALCYQERNCSPHAYTRFIAPPVDDYRKALFLPDTDHPNTELVLTEGTADALAVGQAGYRTAALVGSMLTDERIELIRLLITDKKRLFFIPDNDRAGLLTQVKVQSSFPYCQTIWVPTGTKDFASLSVEKRERLLKEKIQ